MASTEPFDRIGAAYDREVAQALGPFAGEHDHFLEIKARWLIRLARSRLGSSGRLRVLDIGCGVGLLERYLRPLGAPIFGVDVAFAALAAGRRPELRGVLGGSSLPFASATFDLAFMASVLHHVRPELRPSLLREVRRVLRPGGLAVIFEHNPWHPGTRWIVSRCEFDRDAELVGPGTLRRTVRKAALRPVLRRHLLVTPWSGKLFDAVDRALGRLPLGAQYLLAAMPEPGGAGDPDVSMPDEGIEMPLSRDESVPVISVVIPTRNRRSILAATLEALDRQESLPGPVEVLVVDDGSTDGTADWIDADRSRHSYAVRCLRLPGGGPAAARNRAIEVARAPRVLLLGDDTLPEPTVLAEHLEAGRGSVGVQGRIDWDPTFPITPVMDYLAPEGPQFYFRGLRAGQPVPYTAVLGSNLSAPTSWFLDEPFDEGFPAAAFEDTELAYRWLRRGRQVVYWPRARCLHRHPYDAIEPFLRRQRLAGRGARYGISLHPRTAWRIAVLPAAVGAFRGICYLLRRFAGRASPRELWDLRSRAAFLSGLVFRGPRPPVSSAGS